MPYLVDVPYSLIWHHGNEHDIVTLLILYYIYIICIFFLINMCLCNICNIIYVEVLAFFFPQNFILVKCTYRFLSCFNSSLLSVAKCCEKDLVNSASSVVKVHRESDKMFPIQYIYKIRNIYKHILGCWEIQRCMKMNWNW